MPPPFRRRSPTSCPRESEARPARGGVTQLGIAPDPGAWTQVFRPCECGVRAVRVARVTSRTGHVERPVILVLAGDPVPDGGSGASDHAEVVMEDADDVRARHDGADLEGHLFRIGARGQLIEV